jgi:hypothetical protein
MLLRRRRACGELAMLLAPYVIVGTSTVAKEVTRPRLALYVSPAGSDAADGSPAAPLRTIAAASKRAQPSTIVRVAPGVYEGGFTTDASGSPEAPIIYISAVRWGARIVPPNGAGAEVGWENHGAYVAIEGFEMDGSRPGGDGMETPWRLGIYSTGSHSVIRGDYVHHIAISTPCTDMGGAGVEGDSYYGAGNIDLLDNVVHDVGSNECKYIHGIYQTAPGKVGGNVVYQTSGWGIHLWHDAHQVRVAGNVVFGNANGGILVGGGDFVHTRGPADNIVVLGNIVFGNSKYGIVEVGFTGHHNQFACNLSYDNGTNWRLLTSRVQRCEATDTAGDIIPDDSIQTAYSPDLQTNHRTGHRSKSKLRE